jgi:hypothetical protein
MMFVVEEALFAATWSTLFEFQQNKYNTLLFASKQSTTEKQALNRSTFAY